MKRVKAEIIVIGNGGAAMLAASRLMSLGVRTALINPSADFEIGDLRPHSGLGLWNAAYRSAEETSLPVLYDKLVSRMREVFPAALEESGLMKTEYWSVLSTTLIHRAVTQELEKEFFRLERKHWSSGQFRLVNPEHVLVRTRRLGIDLPQVAQIEGAVIRAYGLWWNAARMGLYLSQFVRDKFSQATGEHFCFENASIEGRYGKRIVVADREGGEVSVEAERGIYVFLTGDLLPEVKSIVAACEEPWIQGVRKRRREQHYVWFERPESADWNNSSNDEEDLSMELGGTRYRWAKCGGVATWQATKGPDGLERVVDEGLRLHSLPIASTRFVRSTRTFRLEWDWKYPQWRATSHDTHWATAFEGDLTSIMELLWNLPIP
jgi:hypothetical protein